MKTLIERARELTEAEEWLRIAAERWTNRGACPDYHRATIAKELGERAIRYTRALEAMARRGGTK